MRKRMMIAVLLATLAIGPASAQVRGNIPTDTESRLAGANSGDDNLWNLVGLLGLIGLIGLVPKHEEDSYHPASIE
jgi:hypothetical protein